MMIQKKFLALALVALVLSACGSNNNLTQPGYVTTSTGTLNNYVAQTGYNSYAVPGGSKVLVPVLSGTVSSYGTKVYSVNPTVAAGDQILVNASGSVMNAVGTILGGLSSSTSQAYLSALNVSVNGQLLGSSLNATYTAPAAGTVQIEAVVSLLNLAHTDKTNFITSFTSGVSIAHCVNMANAPMPCPAGY